MARDLYLSRERYILALRRNRDRIAAGLPFSKEDSDCIGDKFTRASWGLCSEDGALWPDAADRLFPDMPGRTKPKYRKPPHRCPMDGRAGRQGGDGCFFKCRIFSAPKRLRAADREKVVRLYDEAIAKAEARA